MANKHMKRCSASLIIRETQIIATVRYHLTPIRTVIIKKLNAGEDVKERKSSCIVGRNDNW